MSTRGFLTVSDALSDARSWDPPELGDPVLEQTIYVWRLPLVGSHRYDWSFRPDSPGELVHSEPVAS